MRLTHIRNATMLVEWDDRALLVDPMLCAPASFQGFKIFGGGRQRNPLVPLPESAPQLLERTTEVLVTHQHADHLDPSAVEWMREHAYRVWCAAIDQRWLKRKGLRAEVMTTEAFRTPVEIVPGRHGRGLLGWLMGPVSGFYFAPPNEPSLYLTGDTVMTDGVMEAIKRLQPEVIVAPAGCANFGRGSDILFPLDDLVALARASGATVIYNHLEAIDHCPTRRDDLRARLTREGVIDKARIPEDGETITIRRVRMGEHVMPEQRAHAKPSFQKWLTSKLG